MQPEIDYREMPGALQHLLTRGQAHVPLPCRAATS